MTQTQIKEMKTLYERLSEVGFPKKFVRDNALPDWWDEEFEATSGAVLEAAVYVSRRLNLDIKSLLKSETTPTFKQSCQPKFKTKQGTKPENILVAQCLAERVAEMIAYTCVTEIKPLPNSAKSVRDEIVQKRQYVDLEGLLEFCWNYGIPVVHFDKFPKSQGVCRFEGMVTFVYERPVIVISSSHHSPAWLLFILGHELGHIIKGHLNGSAIVDEEVNPENQDNEEIEANEFAVELLLGRPDITYYSPRRFTGEELVTYAQNISNRDAVDPGVVVLNYAWGKANQTANKKSQQIIWATARKALKILEGIADAPKKINCYARNYLNLDKLDGDSQDYLELVLEE
jgi:Zn-dependent peptidase ImmA (M78 family)